MLTRHSVNKLEPRAPDEYTIHFDPIEDSEVCSFVWKVCAYRRSAVIVRNSGIHTIWAVS